MLHFDLTSSMVNNILECVRQVTMVITAVTNAVKIVT